MPVDVMWCEAEASAATPKVNRGPAVQPRRTCVVLLARWCCMRARGKQVRIRVVGGANLFVAFLKALLLAIDCGLSALWARVGVGVCCGADPMP